MRTAKPTTIRLIFYPVLFIIPFLNDNISLTKNAFVLAQFTRLGHSPSSEVQILINGSLFFRIGIIPFLVIYHSYVAQTVSLCPIPPHFVKFGNATSFFRIGIIPFLIIYLSFVAQTVSLCPIPPHFVKFGNATSFFRIGYNNQLTSFIILHIIKERKICYRKA